MTDIRELDQLIARSEAFEDDSFVHGGIHAVSRRREGYPAGLLKQAMRQSNNLVYISAMALALHLKDGGVVMSVAAIHTKYADCLQLKPLG